jgi:hypothetical protein
MISSLLLLLLVLLLLFVLVLGFLLAFPGEMQREYE